MKQVKIGVRLDQDEGLIFFGVDEVKGLLNRGATIVSFEPGGAIVHKLDSGDEAVRLALTGCEILCEVDDTPVEESESHKEYEAAYREGADLIHPYMQLVGRETKPADSDQAKHDIDRGIELLEKSLAINPACWAAHWIIGKGQQALGKSADASDAFRSAYKLNPNHIDVVREYMIECLRIGECQKGLAAARRACVLDPDDFRLAANHGLALILSEALDEAEGVLRKCLDVEPEDEMSQKLFQLIQDIRMGKRTQPKTLAELESQ